MIFMIPHTSLVNTYWPLPAVALSSDLKPQLERRIHDRDMSIVYTTRKVLRIMGILPI